MFKKTRIRLVLFNTIVLMVILSIFSLVLYVYMQHVIFLNPDNRLSEMSEQVKKETYMRSRKTMKEKQKDGLRFYFGAVIKN